MNGNNMNVVNAMPNIRRQQEMVKRSIDLMIAIPLTVLLVPIFIIIGIVIKLESAGAMFFRQDRLGYHGTVFRIFKFRTMVEGSSDDASALELYQGDPRITRFGSFLRKYRLDEFPQLFNVILGEMSLVGPRPLLPEYLGSYSGEDRRRMDVLPGMTGWQQVNGAAKNSWKERISLDLWYVDHRSTLMDVLILYRTIMVVLKAETVYDKDGYQRSGVPTLLSETKIKKENLN